jgi:hypothetical protein
VRLTWLRAHELRARRKRCSTTVLPHAREQALFALAVTLQAGDPLPFAEGKEQMSTHRVSSCRTPGRRRVEIDGGDAFIPDFRHGFVAVTDGDVEAWGEEFVAAATSGEAVSEVARDELLDEDIDGLAVDLLFEVDPDDVVGPSPS